MGLYKKLEDNSWLKADLEVFLNNNEIITKENQNYGWKWYDEPPLEYLEWVDNEEKNINNIKS